MTIQPAVGLMDRLFEDAARFPPSEGRTGRSRRRGAMVLVAVASGSFMVIFDGAAVQMTLPVVQQQLGGTIQEVEWAMVAFLLLSTSTLLPFGRAGDVLGR